MRFFLGAAFAAALAATPPPQRGGHEQDAAGRVSHCRDGVRPPAGRRHISIRQPLFDPLFRYDYLARPYKIVPNTAAAMPEISADGKTWTIKLKPGIYFADDPVFKGKRRELTAADYVYSWKRILDPKMRSNNLQVFDGKIVGAEPIVSAARRGRAVRLRRTDGRPAGDRSLHAADEAQLPELRPLSPS